MSSIPYKIKRSPRAKRVSISVHCDAGVVVTAPMRAREATIIRFVEEKMAWIVQTLHDVRAKQKPWQIPAGVAQTNYASCRARSRAFILSRVRHYAPHYGFACNRISVKDMRSRWGSCTGKKNLNFHYRLLFVPLYLADYVIVHELCHLKEMNHSKRFWNLVAQTIPDYRARRNALEGYSLQ